MRRKFWLVGAALLAAATVAVPTSTALAHEAKSPLDKVKHIVVIYEENHSFDNLYGLWGHGVDGLRRADPAHTVQVNQGGTPFTCLLQNDVNLTSPTPLATTCTDNTTGTALASAFKNAPFKIDKYIKPTDTTCPAPGVFAAHGVLKGAGLPGGCTADIVHRYYQEQYQIDGGKMDRYVAGSDAVGLTMGYYNTKKLPIYKYLNREDAPDYVIADHFFQAAFGGSFLNHQWLIAAATPVWPGALSDGSSNDLHSAVGPDGHPNSYPLHTAPGYARDRALTEWCTIPSSLAGSIPAPPGGTACGDYAVNTIQPAYQPFAPGTPPTRQLPPQTGVTIGDRLSAGGVDWAWYSGGWDNAAGNTSGPGWTNGTTVGVCGDPYHATTATYPYCPDKLFQYHHQPFNYYANYAPGTAARAAHLRDEVEFIAAAKNGHLKPVSFVKPIGEDNEHPGYASETHGSQHLVDLIKAVENGPDGKDTLIIVTYDEFGGQWDHVPPPMGKSGVSDQWGPGTRIPALLVSRMLGDDHSVDHTSYDTTSILATIEHRFHLAPLSTRDAAVADLSDALRSDD